MGGDELRSMLCACADDGADASCRQSTGRSSGRYGGGARGVGGFGRWVSAAMRSNGLTAWLYRSDGSKAAFVSMQDMLPMLFAVFYNLIHVPRM